MNITDRPPGNDVIWAAGVNLVVAAWLVAAPQALGYAGVRSALWNDTAIGFAVMVVAAIRIAKPARSAWLSTVNLALAAWLIVSPVALEHGGWARSDGTTP